MTESRSTVPAPRRRSFDVLLVIEDATRELELRLAFEAHGYAARVAQGANEAAAAVRHAIPDVVVCDVHRDERSELHAFAEQLRDDPRTRHVGRVALIDRTGWARDGTAAFEVQIQRGSLHVRTLLGIVHELAITWRRLRVDPVRVSSRS